MTNYTNVEAFTWAVNNHRNLDPFAWNRDMEFTKYRRDLLANLGKIQAGQTSGYNVCFRSFGPGKPNYAAVWNYGIGMSSWVKINTDNGYFFQLPASLPMGTGIVRGGGSQASTLLHELSHMFAHTKDLDFFNWLPTASGAATEPGVAGAGNPTNVPFTKNFSPTDAARDAYFVELFQDNSASSVNLQWINPYLYEKE